ncbi:hypothetical protein Nepgr_028890 [Nepenthes gracilis]|uniref:Cytochrome P450 n=1 Tax=Nepenthes gracilis TaxID=150966 RepID=A0AAD3TEE5_NEPGR|nr:hypothetical protein Nepgr_028890 [Nepenthes gracilis]
MDSLLDTLDTAHENLSKFDLDTIIKATCLNIISAASDTSTITLTWTLSLLLNNRCILKKVQHELETHIGGQRLVNESDLQNLIYLRATLKEAIRLYPAGPLSVPREAITDSYICGYHVPRGTQLFVNLYKIQRDPSIWSDPDEFHPERFLTTHKAVDVRGQSFELLPFGSGRRMCPGISFAFRIILFTLANLLHGFEITTPLDELVDMTESFGLANAKATSLEAICTPRLPGYLYSSTSNVQ